MNTPEQRTFSAIYRRAGSPGRLPWSHDEPTQFLSAIVSARPPGTAMDIGCGSGVDSVFLAQQGWQVTSIDFMAPALAMTRERCAQAGVITTTVQADVTSWATPQRFDLILDAGVLHNMKPARHAAYRLRILEWLAPAGDFVLVHFLKRHVLDWRPIGPRRRTRADLCRMFAPDLREANYHERLSAGLPIIIGPSMIVATYHFRRA